MHLILAGIVVALALIAATAIARALRGLRGTTLPHACIWSLVSLLMIAACESLVALPMVRESQRDWTPALRLVAATSTFCPMMAVLGARRPQHHAWQFVVITMWIMLSLPALEAIFLGRLAAMDVGPVRGWFLWLMVAVSWLTYAPTRFAAASLLVTLGQVLLLAPFLPGIDRRVAYDVGAVIAMALFMLAAIATSVRWPPARATKSEFDRRWIQFRDTFGTMWALHMIERINATARIRAWPLSLTWSGFYFHDAEQTWSTLSPQVEQDLRQALDNLLRRFT